MIQLIRDAIEISKFPKMLRYSEALLLNSGSVIFISAAFTLGPDIGIKNALIETKIRKVTNSFDYMVKYMIMDERNITDAPMMFIALRFLLIRKSLI
jgi:hypothetical protein